MFYIKEVEMKTILEYKNVSLDKENEGTTVKIIDDAEMSSESSGAKGLQAL